MGPGPEMSLLFGASRIREDCERQVVEPLLVLHAAALLHHSRLELIVLVKALGHRLVVQLGGSLAAILGIADCPRLGAHLASLLRAFARVRRSAVNKASMGLFAQLPLWPRSSFGASCCRRTFS